MPAPKRIRPKGSESTYILESVAPNKTGEKVKYQDHTYVKEELPSEYVMFEGVAFKRGMSLDEYNKKAMMESATGKAPKKIRIKGTNKILEAVDSQWGSKGGSNLIQQVDKALDIIESAGRDISGSGFGDPRSEAYETARKALYDLLEVAKKHEGTR